MSDYNQFVLAVNKIFEITAKMKAGWREPDNINIIDSIEEAKTDVIESSKIFNAKATPQNTSSSKNIIENSNTVNSLEVLER